MKHNRSLVTAVLLTLVGLFANCTQAAPLSATEVAQLATEAYIYGYPLVTDLA
jgi:hypothetical protein